MKLVKNHPFLTSSIILVLSLAVMTMTINPFPRHDYISNLFEFIFQPVIVTTALLLNIFSDTNYIDYALFSLIFVYPLLLGLLLDKLKSNSKILWPTIIILVCITTVTYLFRHYLLVLIQTQFHKI